MTIKRLICIILVLLLCISVLCTFSSCEESEHQCMKCNGSGKVRDEYGYYAYVKCPRCQGKGYLVY